MTVVIGEVITEIVVSGGASAAGADGSAAATGGASPVVDEDAIVRRATERVLEILRREWER
ncbi:MAG: DUF5908 family protein [Agromyces sp.]